MWLNWVIFVSSERQISEKEVAQIFDDFLGYFEKDYFYVKSSTNTFWGNFWK